MANIRLSGSVGIGGKNNSRDILAVQQALNQLLYLLIPSRELVEDGKVGRRPERSNTVAAIELFQSRVIGSRNPDGRIDANGRTHQTINEKLIAGSDPVKLIKSTPWMNTAQQELGQKEIAGSKANPRIMAYHKAAKYAAKDDSGGVNAWCASFIAWVMTQNGYQPVHHAMGAKSWTHFGKKIKSPVYGAIAIKSRKGGGHVAFVVGRSRDNKYLYMLGGNQSDMVRVTRYPLSVWNTFVVPSNFDISGASLPVYVKPAANAGRED